MRASRRLAIYTNGNKIFLYKNGDECTAITGGWQGRAWARADDKGVATTPEVTKNASNIRIALWTATGYRDAVLEVKNNIDLTNIKTITTTFSHMSLVGMYTGVYVYVQSRSATYWHTGSAAHVTVANGDGIVLTNKTVSLNVASLKGSYDVFVAITARGETTSKNAGVQATMTQMVLSR